MSLTSIYLSTVAIIALMLFTAFMNRRSGWRKPRTDAVRDLFQLGAVFDRTEPEALVAVWEPLTTAGCADFTMQLVNLQFALHPQERVAPPVGVESAISGAV